MEKVPLIQEEISPGVFCQKADYSQLKNKELIQKNFGTLSVDGEMMFFETKEEYEQYSIKPVIDPNVKVGEPVTLTEEEQIKLRALLAAQEASQINTK